MLLPCYHVNWAFFRVFSILTLQPLRYQRKVQMIHAPGYKFIQPSNVIRTQCPLPRGLPNRNIRATRCQQPLDSIRTQPFIDFIARYTWLCYEIAAVLIWFKGWQNTESKLQARLWVTSVAQCNSWSCKDLRTKSPMMKKLAHCKDSIVLLFCVLVWWQTRIRSSPNRDLGQTRSWRRKFSFCWLEDILSRSSAPRLSVFRRWTLVLSSSVTTFLCTDSVSLLCENRVCNPLLQHWMIASIQFNWSVRQRIDKFDSKDHSQTSNNVTPTLFVRRWRPTSTNKA